MSAIAIRNIDHVVVRAADLDRSLKFYCEVLGCRVERRVDRIGHGREPARLPTVTSSATVIWT